jgi:hypothetical protein
MYVCIDEVLSVSRQSLDVGAFPVSRQTDRHEYAIQVFPFMLLSGKLCANWSHPLMHLFAFAVIISQRYEKLC